MSTDNAPPSSWLRRLLLATGLAALSPATRTLAQTPPRTSRRLSLAEHDSFRHDPPERIAKRFALYQAAGIGTLRCGIGWDDMESSQGQWRLPTEMPYLRQAIQAGFALKLAPSTMGALPPWFMKAHPEMLLRDQIGDTTNLSLSLWHPDLAQVLDTATAGIGKTLAGHGILDAPNYIIIDYGPAAEPKYPSAWNMNSKLPGGMFWCYDDHARASFAAAMQQKYHGISTANAAWGTGFAAWRDVTPPRPGAGSPALWQDMLVWYRDSKRSFSNTQLTRYQGLLRDYGTGNPNLVSLVAGSHMAPAQWAESGPEAAQTGAMIDSAYTIDIAAKTGCMLQYTGAQDTAELAWIRNYLQQIGHGATPLWGENSGSKPNAHNNPQALAEIGARNHLYGVEYIDSGNLFEADGITPNPWFAKLEAGYQAALNSFAVS